MKYNTNKNLSTQFVIYAFIGVMAKILKISIFFAPLHFFLNYIENSEEQNALLNINLPLLYGMAFVLATSIIIQIIMTYRLKMREALSVVITDSLFNNGNLKHSNPQNSYTNSIITFEEHKAVIAIYSFILSVLSYYSNPITMFVLLPLLAYIYVRVFLNIVSIHISRQRFFILSLNLFLLFYVYLGIFSIYQPGVLNSKISILIFYFFLFRFLIDASSKLVESSAKLYIRVTS